MKFNDINIYDSRRIGARITDPASSDVPKVRLKYSTQGVLFLPDHVHVEYNRADGGPWECLKANVSGPRVLKSGELSKMTSHRNDYCYPLGLKESDVPGFLWEFIKDNWPEDDD